MPRDLRTQALVLRRTNYGESDRILTFLTPEGKISALAHGVRKEKSRLAGGVELFCITDVVIHEGRGRLATLTGAKMLKFYSRIVENLPSLELAASMMKKIERVTEQVTSPEYYSLLVQSLEGLQNTLNLDLIRTWFLLNLARISGEEINLAYDTKGDKLDQALTYHWDSTESALRPDPSGNISAREIKFARFLLNNKLALAAKIDNFEDFLPPLSNLAKILDH